MHDAAPADEKEPSAQRRHTPPVPEFLYFPAAQIVQELVGEDVVNAVSVVYPSAQATQVAAVTV